MLIPMVIISLYLKILSSALFYAKNISNEPTHLILVLIALRLNRACAKVYIY